MSADHRKPVVAFVLLALAATALVGVQRAEGHVGRLLDAVISVGGQAEAVHGLIEPTSTDALEVARARVATLGPAFLALTGGADQVTILDAPLALPHGPGDSGLTTALTRSGQDVAGLLRAAGAREGDAGERSAGGAGRVDPAGRTTGKPEAPRERMDVTSSDGGTRPGASPAPGSGTSTRPTTVVHPAQAGDRTARELRRERHAQLRRPAARGR